jgi:tRNA A-37 threonylcarbamoyl transferase component Bud32
VSIGPGAILGGKYRLEDSIGRGGMGEVFEATTLTTGQRVAVKIVNRAFADTMLMERLRREAEAARRVHSEFVPLLFDVDKTPEEELFLVMELLNGETLASRMRRRGGVLSWEELSHLGEDVLRGLFDAHAAGVIHRDLKPGNIFIESMPGRRERARILDFGVCKLDVHDGESLTTTGEAVGTIAYMAPEQIRGASKVDERADLYAFAMVVFEALSGRLAYDAGGSIALIACKLEKPARSIRDLGRMPVPPGLDALLARCLARRPAERPASAAELLREWRNLGPATVQPTPQPAGGQGSDLPTETGVTAAPTRLTRTARRGARLGLVVAGAALVASFVVLVVALSVRGAPPPRAAAATASPREAPAAESPATAPPAGESAPVTAATATPATTTVGPPPAIELSQVVLSATTDVPDAGRPAAGRSRPGRRTGSGSAGPSSAPPRRTPTEPQIVTEPRY